MPTNNWREEFDKEFWHIDGIMMIPPKFLLLDFIETQISLAEKRWYDKWYAEWESDAL